MNQNEINGAEFSGAAASNILTRFASAVATAIVSGSGVVYRGVSSTVTQTAVVAGLLRNQFNGLLLLATSIAADTLIEAKALRVTIAAALVSFESAVSSSISRVYAVTANVQGAITLIIANLLNQFNGVITFAANVTTEVTVSGRIVAVKLLNAIVSANTIIITAVLFGLKLVKTSITTAAVEIEATLKDFFDGIKFAASEIVHTTEVQANAIGVLLSKTVATYAVVVTAKASAIKNLIANVSHISSVTAFIVGVKKARAVLLHVTIQSARLAAVNLAKSTVQSVVNLLAIVRVKFSGKIAIRHQVDINADLKASTNVPASPENTFIVPEDDVQYTVEE